MKAPFPYFGGKSIIASMVWDRFGDVKNYVEPFAGSLAVLLGRPHRGQIETINDVDCYVANFWRAVQHDPEAVADWADWPVNEADLSARHLWLLQYRPLKVQADPDYFDAKIAGWWLWGVCAWIGSGWCSGKGPWQNVDGELAKGGAGRGINRKLPELETRREYIAGIMRELHERLRNVRVCCGDWSRTVTNSVTVHLGQTGVFLDPPYTEAADCFVGAYANEDKSLGHTVAKWAMEHGEDPKLRIAVCGYEGEHRFPEAWECVPWKAHGGFGGGRNGRGERNRHRERIWFSPHCLKEADNDRR